MSHEWSPRPRRAMNLSGLFSFVEEPVPVRKGQPAIVRQREADGTPITRTPPSALRPADVPLFMRGHEPVQKSLPTKEDQQKQVEKAAQKAYDIIKSYVFGQ